MAAGLKLIKLTKDYEKQLREMLDEWKAELERTGAKPIPAPLFRNDPFDIGRYIDELEYKTPTEAMVPDSVYFLYDSERDILIGAVHIRHYLNDALRRWSGHIGIGIRPGERRKGHATEMLRLALVECKRLGIDRVQITCDKENIGSAKAIIKNGGVPECEFLSPNGAERQRYIIII
jgi:predicted acetyltransferase